MLHNQPIKAILFNFIAILPLLAGATTYASDYIASKDGLNVAKDTTQYDALNTVTDAGIKTAVSGGSFTDNLKNSAIDTIGQNAAGAIGANKESLGQLGQKLAHAGLGCTITSAGGGDCASGAFGAVVGEMLAEGIGKSDLDDDTVLMLSQIGIITLASSVDLNVEDAEKTGTNAVKNNYLSTRQKEKYAKELKDCQGVMACGLTVVEKYGVSISQDAVLGTGIVAGLGEGLYDEAKELVEALSDPAQAIEGLKALLSDPSLIKDIAQAELDEIKGLLTDFETNYEIAGTSGAFDAGQNLGKIAGKTIALLGGAATGVGGVAVGTSKVVGKVASKLKNTIHTRKVDNLIASGNNNSADWANSQFPEGYKPPYTPGTQVTDFVSDGKTKFVRVVSSDKPNGQWIMKQSDIEGLTPQQIADKFALKNIPTGITSIKPPAGTKIRTGEVNKNFGRSGGGTQFQLLDRIKGWSDVTPL